MTRNRPTAAQRMPVWKSPGPPPRGCAYRTMDAMPREDGHELLARIAVSDLAWRDRVTGYPMRTGPRTWTITIRETANEREARLRALGERRDR